MTQEPLVIRRIRFTRIIRYSCLHSHSHGLHHSVTRQLHHPLDAPLPNTHKTITVTTQHPTRTQKALTGSVRGNVHCHDFGGVLEPRYIIGAESLDQ